MKIIDNNLIVVCDIDDTLLMRDGIKYWEPTEGSIEILHPLNGEHEYPVPHTEHIKLLKSYKAQGYTIIVWSAQGWEWANAAVIALGLHDTVAFCMSKPLKYVDDLRGPEGILGSRVYIPFGIYHKTIEPGNKE